MFNSSNYFRPHAAVYLILRQQDKLLLARRLGSWGNGEYSLVAGHMDGGETAMQAMAREAKEEVDIDLDPKSLRTRLVMHRISSDREYFDLFLEADDYRGTPRICEPTKCDDLGFFGRDALPSNLQDHVRFALQSIEAGENYVCYGWDAVVHQP